MAKNKENKEITSLAELKASIESAHGDGALMIGRGSIVPVDIIPTRVATIDRALGVGGLPQGRIMEIYGSESSGKTTTCLQFIAACQQHYFEKKGRQGVAAFIDAEHALDPEWAENIGVDMEKLLMSQPDSGEEVFQITEKLVKSNMVDLIIIDSVAALIPKEELNGEIGDHHVGAQARMMSQGMRKLKGEIHKYNCSVVFINQIREKIGVRFGNPEMTPGGRALKFYASVRGEISKGTKIVDGDDIVGFRPKIKFIKNKVAPPFTYAEYDICVGHPSRPTYGIDTAASLLDVALDDGIVVKKGNFFSYGEDSLGNGRKQAIKALSLNGSPAQNRTTSRLVSEIRDKVYDKMLGCVKMKSSDFDTTADVSDIISSIVESDDE